MPSGARPPATTRSRLSAHAASACAWSAYHSSRPPTRTRYRRRQRLDGRGSGTCGACLGRHRGWCRCNLSLARSHGVGSPLNSVTSDRLATAWAASALISHARVRGRALIGCLAAAARALIAMLRAPQAVHRDGELLHVRRVGVGERGALDACVPATRVVAGGECRHHSYV